MVQQGKILVIRGGAIGDFILTLPVLSAIRANLPIARVEVLGYERTARLALLGGLADAVRPIDARPLAEFFARNGDLQPQLCEFFSGFQIIVSYLFDPDGIFQANIARCSKAQFLAGPHRPSERENVHACEVFLKPLERLAIFDADPVPALKLPAAPARAGSPKWLAIHPGSGSERKNWPEQHWAQLLPELVRRTSLHLLLVGGEAEGDRLDRLSVTLPSDRHAIARNLPLPDLAQRLNECAALLGHDSGIGHLAAALRLPTIALWGPTAQAIWRPRGEHVRILHHPDGLQALAPATVLEAVQALPL